MSESTAIATWVELTRPALKTARKPREHETLRRLFWLYFWLLIGEGVLRKWVLPSLSTPLLLIRDPIPLAVLWVGIRQGVFPRTVGVYIWATLALALTIAGFFMLYTSPQVVLYGFKCDFLHLTMLGVAPIVFDSEDLDRIIRAIIYVSVPIALLMAWQFHSAPDAWINSGVDGTFKQLESTQGHIRPPGPFSFTAGSAAFCTLLAAVLMGAAVDRRRISKRLLFVGACALVVSALYSASRGLVGDVVIVVVTGMFGALAGNPKIFGRFVGLILVFGFVAIFLGTSSMMQDTVDVFSSRVDTASSQEGGAGGLLDRYFGDYASVVPAVQSAPPAGYGLGVGTNGGASILTGSTKFLLAEREWPRIVYESGPVLGLLFIGFRLSLMVWLGWGALQAVRRGSVLAACLFGACGTELAAAQFGQATILGFTVFTASLCIAASRRPTVVAAEGERSGPGVPDGAPVTA